MAADQVAADTDVMIEETVAQAAADILLVVDTVVQLVMAIVIDALHLVKVTVDLVVIILMQDLRVHMNHVLVVKKQELMADRQKLVKEIKVLKFVLSVFQMLRHVLRDVLHTENLVLRRAIMTKAERDINFQTDSCTI